MSKSNSLLCSLKLETDTPTTPPTYNLPALTKAIESGASIATRSDGTWYERWDPLKLISFFRRLFGFEQNDNLQLASLVKHFIKSTEIISGNLHVQHTPESNLDIKLAIRAVKQRLKPLRIQEQEERKAKLEALSELKTLWDLTKDGLALAKQYNPEPDTIGRLEESLSNLETKIKYLQKTIKHLELSNPATKKINKLKALFFAKVMRQEPQYVIENSNVNDKDRQWLKQELVQWKKPQFPAMPVQFDNDGKPIFTNDDLYKIEALCKYEKAVSLMREDRNYRDYIFKFVFKNTNESCPNAVDIAMQFPTLAKQISKSFIDKRVKRLANTIGLSFKEELDGSTIKKDVFLRVQKENEPLRDMTRKITFLDKNTESPRVLSIDEIFKEFRFKDDTGTSAFEYTENGIELCHPKKPLLNFASKTWWDGLPVLERLTRQEVEKKYNVTLAGKKAVLALRASREKDPLNIENNHGWLQVVIPREDGSFTVHGFGKYTFAYPQGTLETLFFIFNTHPGVIATIDENEFYAHREHCMVPKTLSEAQFERLMDKMKRDLQDSLSGNMVFQSQGQNCCAWVQEVLDDVFGKDEQGQYSIPRLFEVPIIETSAPSPINKVISTVRWIEKFSHHLAKITRLALASLLGGKNTVTTIKDGKEVHHSTVTYEPWLRGYQALPALLFSREKQQKLRDAFDKLN